MSPRNEPHFFEIMHSNFRRPGRRSTPVTNLGDYRALSEGVSDEKAIGEASASYLYSSKAPGLIKCSIPDLNSSPSCALRQRGHTRIFCAAYRSVVNPSLASPRPCRLKRHVCGIVGPPLPSDILRSSSTIAPSRRPPCASGLVARHALGDEP